MTQEIMNQYQVKFKNKILDYNEFGKSLTKVVETNNRYLNELLNFCSNPQEIEDFLLIEINQALLNPSAEIENGSETINILIYQNKVDFYTLDEGFVYTIPTSDFKQIVEGWRDFLQTPPLNGPYVVS